MMENFITAILQQSPGLAVALILVISGLKYLEASEKRNSAERILFWEKMQKINDECNGTQKETTKIISDCVYENVKMLGQVRHALDRIKI